MPVLCASTDRRPSALVLLPIGHHTDSHAIAPTPARTPFGEWFCRCHGEFDDDETTATPVMRDCPVAVCLPAGDSTGHLQVCRCRRPYDLLERADQDLPQAGAGSREPCPGVPATGGEDGHPRATSRRSTNRLRNRATVIVGVSLTPNWLPSRRISSRRGRNSRNRKEWSCPTSACRVARSAVGRCRSGCSRTRTRLRCTSATSRPSRKRSPICADRQRLRRPNSCRTRLSVRWPDSMTVRANA
jgi:hypothetical protein